MKCSECILLVCVALIYFKQNRTENLKYSHTNLVCINSFLKSDNIHKNLCDGVTELVEGVTLVILVHIFPRLLLEDGHSL